MKQDKLIILAFIFGVITQAILIITLIPIFSGYKIYLIAQCSILFLIGIYFWIFRKINAYLINNKYIEG